MGKILALTILYEVHDITRFETVQQFASYSRLVKCSRESAGKRIGIGGAKIGNVHLKWTFSEAAVLYLRSKPGRPEVSGTTHQETRQGQGTEHPGSQARSCDLFCNDSRPELRREEVPGGMTEGSG